MSKLVEQSETNKVEKKERVRKEGLKAEITIQSSIYSEIMSQEVTRETGRLGLDLERLKEIRKKIKKEKEEKIERKEKMLEPLQLKFYLYLQLEYGKEVSLKYMDLVTSPKYKTRNTVMKDSFESGEILPWEI